jgi:glycerate kinase
LASSKTRRKSDVLLAPAAFKGTLSAPQICRVLGHELQRHRISFRAAPIADGGDGTLDALRLIFPDTRVRTFQVTGPHGRPVKARVLASPRRVFIEMAEAAGLRLMRRLDAWNSTTFGVGELIRLAGRREVVIGIGGSVTNDAGAGVLQALGAQLMDRNGNPIPPGGGGLGVLERIMWPRRPSFRMTVLTDVDNPLLGPRGASRTYGPQKGADPAMVLRLERNLDRFARIVKRDLGVELRAIEGGGAAGGLGAALIGVLGARRVRGADFILKHVDVQSARVLVTGEGRIDATTFQGKAVGELCRRARGPLILVAGSSALTARQAGADEIITLSQAAGSAAEAIRRPFMALRRAARVLISRLSSYL